MKKDSGLVYAQSLMQKGTNLKMKDKKYAYATWKTCYNCHGTGRDWGFFFKKDAKVCSACNGMGYYDTGIRLLKLGETK